MRTRKSLERIWHRRESGLVVPKGTVSDVSDSSSQTYLQIKKKAQALDRLYAASDVTLPPTCDLARLIAEAKALSDSWFLNRVDKLSVISLFRASHLDRIANAVLPLEHVSNRTKYLTRATA